MGSNLIISNVTQQFTMNVTGFSSPMYESIASAQTNSMAVFFPIKMSQPNMHFDVQFANDTDFMNFQFFVRNHQTMAVGLTQPLTLSWPERNIINFTGVIQKFVGGQSRANYAPTASFDVSLFNSTVSTTTIVASIANPWFTIYGLGMVDGVLGGGTVPSALALDSYGQQIVPVTNTGTGSTTTSTASVATNT